jgi:hypothetical protein
MSSPRVRAEEKKENIESVKILWFFRSSRAAPEKFML